MPVIVGLIHADWCGHCQRLLPKWNQMKEHLNINHELMEIEASDPQKNVKFLDLNKRIQGNKEIYVNGYPTVFRVDNNGKLDYFDKAPELEQLTDFFNNADASQTPAPLYGMEDTPDPEPIMEENLKEKKKTRKKRKRKDKKRESKSTKRKSKRKTAKRKTTKRKIIK